MYLTPPLLRRDLNSIAMDIGYLTPRCLDVKIPDEVPHQVRSKARNVAGTTVGGLDCIGDGEDELAANVLFATTATLLRAAQDELGLQPETTVVIDIGSCTVRFCMYASLLGRKAIGIEVNSQR